MTDQQRWDALGCVSSHMRTPNLDRLARRGVRFENCYTTAPQCVPARISLATGLYPHTTGVWKNQPVCLSPRCPTWMRVLREAGYRTSLFGKTHLHEHGGDLREREHLLHAYGLDDVDEIGGPRASASLLSHMTARWEALGLWEAYRADYADRFATKPHVVRPTVLPDEEYADAYVGRRAREYLADYDRGQPWMCWVSFGGPHEPWDTPASWAKKFDPADMPRPTLRAGWMSQGDTTLSSLCKHWPDGFDADDVAAMRADYVANVALIDDQIGRLFDVLEERGELDDAVIVFTSDHGEHNGDAGLIYKDTFLDGSARIPMIVSTPDGARGAVASTPCELIDVGPTLCAAAGVEIPHRQFGRSLLPAASAPDASVRDHAVSEFDGELMLATQDRKLMLDPRGEPHALLDRRDDPAEQCNLLGTVAMDELLGASRRFLMSTQLHEPREIVARPEDLVRQAGTTA